MNNSKKGNFFHSAKKWLVTGTSTVAALCMLLGATLYSNTVEATNADAFTTTKLVSAPQTLNTKVESKTEGLTITSDVEYEAFINGVFDTDENVAIDFDWAMTNTTTVGTVIFRLTDISNAANYVDVVYTNHSHNNTWKTDALTAATNAGYDVSQYKAGDSRYRSGASYVQWGNEIRSTNPGGGQLYNSVQTGNQTAFPTFTVDPLHEETQKDGTLQLLWEKDGSGKDVLTVTTAGLNSGNVNQRVRARFDGTYDTSATDNGFVYDSATPKNSRWGLPYINFSQGYTISIISTTSTDLEVKKLTVGGSVSFGYQTNSNKTLHRTATLTGGTAYDLTQETIETPSFYEPYANYAEDAKAIPLDVISADENTVIDTKGIGSVISAPVGTAYSGEFPIRFKGTTAIEFAFPVQQTEPIGHVEFAFTVVDANGVDQFKVVYNGNKYTNCWVEYGKQVRSYSYGNSSLGYGYHYWYDTKPNADRSFFAPQMATVGKYLTDAATLTLAYDSDGVMTVKAIYAKDTTKNEVTIAKFDGSNDGFTAPEAGVVKEAEFTAWGLPKLDLSKGYSIKFSCENTKNVPVNIISFTADAYTPVVSFGDGAAEIEAKYKGEYTLPAYTGTLAADEQFVGWLNKADNKLYKAGTIISNVRTNVEFEAQTISFKMRAGASLRIVAGDTTQSGIRFETAYDVEDYAKLESFIKSKGTLITLRSYLNEAETTAKSEFTVEKIQSISANSVIKNTKKTYTVNKPELEGYALYSAAINEIGETNGAVKLAARGYLEVEYADGSIGYIYTDWTEENNVRSVADTANRCQQSADYQNLTTDEKTVVDHFAAMNG